LTITKQAARKARYKLLRTIFTTYGYALVGGAAIQPLTAAAAPNITVGQVASLALGLLLQLAALYIAPQGD
jgi:hypothetical protein